MCLDISCDFRHGVRVVEFSVTSSESVENRSTSPIFCTSSQNGVKSVAGMGSPQVPDLGDPGERFRSDLARSPLNLARRPSNSVLAVAKSSVIRRISAVYLIFRSTGVSAAFPPPGFASGTGFCGAPPTASVLAMRGAIANFRFGRSLELR